MTAQELEEMTKSSPTFVMGVVQKWLRETHGIDNTMEGRLARIELTLESLLGSVALNRRIDEAVEGIATESSDLAPELVDDYRAVGEGDVIQPTKRFLLVFDKFEDEVEGGLSEAKSRGLRRRLEGFVKLVDISALRDEVMHSQKDLGIHRTDSTCVCQCDRFRETRSIDSLKGDAE